MELSDVTNLSVELQRLAEEKFGPERAKALGNDLEQLARELQALKAYDLGYDDEP